MPRTININDRVRIKLTDKGRAQLNTVFGQNFTDSNVKDGTIQLQLWEVMAVFGEKTCMGLQLCFDPTIELLEE